MLLVFCVSMAVPAFADGETKDSGGFADEYYRLQDLAGILTDFTDAGIAYIGERMGDDLSAGNYADASCTFIRFANQFVTQARDGEPFNKADMPKEPLSAVWIVISLVVGFVLAKIIVGSMKSQLKTVWVQLAAGSYVRQGSMNITESMELFLYNKLDRTEKPKNNSSGSSTHTLSSGTRHGGGGGKF